MACGCVASGYGSAKWLAAPNERSGRAATSVHEGPAMTALFTAAREIQTFCRRQKWRFCIIGGIAVQRWGEPRTTRDVDFTLLTGYGREERFLDALLKEFRSEER